MPTVKEILIEWLKKNGYDGLLNDECGCKDGDLMVCGEFSGDCEPGYLYKGDEDCDYDYVITREKISDVGNLLDEDDDDDNDVLRF